MRGHPRWQGLPHLRGQLHLVFGGQHQQCVPVALQHLRRLVAGELDHHIARPGPALDRFELAAPDQESAAVFGEGKGVCGVVRL